jgi:hypothetical protein
MRSKYFASIDVRLLPLFIFYEIIYNIFSIFNVIIKLLPLAIISLVSFLLYCINLGLLNGFYSFIYVINLADFIKS